MMSKMKTQRAKYRPKNVPSKKSLPNTAGEAIIRPLTPRNGDHSSKRQLLEPDTPRPRKLGQVYSSDGDYEDSEDDQHYEDYEADEDNEADEGQDSHYPDYDFESDQFEYTNPTIDDALKHTPTHRIAPSPRPILKSPSTTPLVLEYQLPPNTDHLKPDERHRLNFILTKGDYRHPLQTFKNSLHNRELALDPADRVQKSWFFNDPSFHLAEEMFWLSGFRIIHVHEMLQFSQEHAATEAEEARRKRTEKQKHVRFSTDVFEPSLIYRPKGVYQDLQPDHPWRVTLQQRVDRYNERDRREMEMAFCGSA